MYMSLESCGKKYTHIILISSIFPGTLAWRGRSLLFFHFCSRNEFSRDIESAVRLDIAYVASCAFSVLFQSTFLAKVMLTPTKNTEIRVMEGEKVILRVKLKKYFNTRTW